MNERTHIRSDCLSLAIIFSQDFVDSKRAAGIAGGAPGVSTRYKLLPNGYSIVIFGNLDLPTAPKVADIFAYHLN